MRQAMAVRGLTGSGFKEVGLAFKVTFRLEGHPLPFTPRPETHTDDPDLAKVIAYLKKKGRIKAKEIIAITGKSSSHIHRKINEWKTSGLIDWRGKVPKTLLDIMSSPESNQYPLPHRRPFMGE